MRVRGRGHMCKSRQTGQGHDHIYFIRPFLCPTFYLMKSWIKESADIACFLRLRQLCRQTGTKTNTELTREATLFGTGGKRRTFEVGHSQRRAGQGNLVTSGLSHSFRVGWACFPTCLMPTHGHRRRWVGIDVSCLW